MSSTDTARVRRGRIGWDRAVPPNGHQDRAAAIERLDNDNALGLDTPPGEVDIETTPEHRNLVAGDPRCRGWTRDHDDPNVVALRERMWEHNGIRGLEVCAPDEIDRAAALFHRDGFVAVRDALTEQQLDRLRVAADEVIDQLLAADPHAEVGGVSVRDLPVPVAHINLPPVDLTPENGPIRQIPGTHRSRAPIPRLSDEPEWMRFSTLCPLPAGAAIIRDARCWHGGTPNLSRQVRAMPNVEYFAPWFRSEALARSMSDEMWRTLSPHAQRVSRYVVCRPDEPVVGAGVNDPRAAERDHLRDEQLAEMDPTEAELYLRRNA